MWGLLRKVVHVIGRRGSFLSFLVLLDFLYGGSLLSLHPASRAALSPSLLLPVHAWGWVWIGVGVFLVPGVFMRWDQAQFVVAAVWKTTWGTLFVNQWVHGVQHAWVTAAIWLSFALIILLVAGWPEPFQLPAPKDKGAG